MILLVDNYDSFTFNLYQLLATRAPAGERVRVVRSDALGPAEVVALAPSRVVLSPGPGHPREARLCLEISDALPRTPILGVCLGHQALALGLGARIARAPRPTHGASVLIEHEGRGLLTGLPAPFEAALYHSLVVEGVDLPAALEVVGRSPAGDVMAVAHTERPHHGVQFHPESFMTSAGLRLADNFLSARCPPASPIA